jgi:hypothetical protein
VPNFEKGLRKGAFFYSARGLGGQGLFLIS